MNPPTKLFLLCSTYSRRAMLLVAVLISSPWGLSAVEADKTTRLAKADEFFILATAGLDQKTLFKTAADSALAQFAGAPPTALEEGRATMSQMMNTLWTDYHDYFVNAYATEFTASELEQLVALMKLTRSPLMAKFQNFQKLFDADSKRTLAELNGKFAVNLTERLRTIVAQHGVVSSAATTSK